MNAAAPGIDIGTLCAILGVVLTLTGAIVTVATAYLRLFVRNEIGTAKADIIHEMQGYVTKEALDDRLRLELAPIFARLGAVERAGR